MTLSSLITNLELSKRLKELGVPQKSYFRWCLVSEVDPTTAEPESKKEWKLDRRDGGLGMHVFYEEVSAFLSGELGEILPAWIEYKYQFVSWKVAEPFGGGWCVSYREPGKTDDFVPMIHGKNEADARGEMVAWLIKNHLLEIPGEKNV